MTFRRAAWLQPAAFVLHIAEDAPAFPAWARRHASPRCAVAATALAGVLHAAVVADQVFFAFGAASPVSASASSTSS